MKKIHIALTMLLLTTLVVVPPTHVANAQAAHARSFTSYSQVQQSNEPASRTNRIIVKFKDTTGPLSTEAEPREVQRLNASSGMKMKYLRTMDGDAQILELSERLPLEQVQALSQQLM